MKDILAHLLLATLFVAVFGAFTDLLTSREAVLVLVACGLPLTALSKIIN